MPKFLLFLFSLLLCLPASGFGAGDVQFNHRSFIYETISLLQNNYFAPPDNVVLLKGAVQGLDDATESSVSWQEADGKVEVVFPGKPPLVIDRQATESDAMKLLDTLYRFAELGFEALPEMDHREVVHSLLDGLISSLDPHSNFIRPEEYRKLLAERRGLFEGIGLEVTTKNDRLTVIAPYDDTPASRAGLLPNDVIQAIDGQSTDGMNIIKAINLIRGPEGSSVTLTVSRKSWPEPRQLNIERRVLPLHSIIAKTYDDGMVYLKITKFLDNTFADFSATLEEIGKQQVISGVVLDLRNNPGGLLNQAVMVADKFLDKGVIFSSRSWIEKENITYQAWPNRAVNQPRIIVLVNEGSASATEIVASALHENQRAILLGAVTFGKGTIQTVFPFKGGAIRLTTAKIFTSKGHEVQLTGIYPDLVVHVTPRDPETIRREADLFNTLEKETETEAMLPREIILLKKPGKDDLLELAFQILRASKGQRFQDLKESFEEHIKYYATPRMLYDTTENGATGGAEKTRHGLAPGGQEQPDRQDEEELHPDGGDGSGADPSQPFQM